uniref:Protein quiver n=1 Tax=Syphacia muris TaxID=451379 RepID=A0A0N5ABT3_9BILA
MINCCIWRWLKHSILLLFLLFFLLLTHTSANLVSPIRRCHSCASLSYLNVWSQLMQVYFPPMNYTDHCWDPVFDMGSVACTTACITMVEQIITENYNEYAVIRGCIDRFLLFGLDEDVHNAFVIKNGCRIADRQLLNLKPLQPYNTRVTVCSCTSGSYCNNENRDATSWNSLLIYVFMWSLSFL